MILWASGVRFPGAISYLGQVALRYLPRCLDVRKVAWVRVASTILRAKQVLGEIILDLLTRLMVNLLKFRETSRDGNGSGRDAYMRYAAVARPLLEELGAVVIWVGSVDHLALHEGGDGDWDMVQLVYYPSRETFINMVTSEVYLAANEHRANGAEKHVIYATTTMVNSSLRQK